MIENRELLDFLTYLSHRYDIRPVPRLVIEDQPFLARDGSTQLGTVVHGDNERATITVANVPDALQIVAHEVGHILYCRGTYEDPKFERELDELAAFDLDRYRRESRRTEQQREAKSR